jgi:hypothetical protein
VADVIVIILAATPALLVLTVGVDWTVRRWGRRGKEAKIRLVGNTVCPELAEKVVEAANRSWTSRSPGALLADASFRWSPASSG